MARFSTGCILAALAMLCLVESSPVMAEASGFAAYDSYPCPPSCQPIREIPAPVESACPAESDIKPQFPLSPGHPPRSRPLPQRTEQPFDSQTPSASNFTPPSTQMPPALATPTFNPSALPTTSATSAQVSAPNMIGDLFGTSFSGSVPVVIDNFYGYGSLTDLGGAPAFDANSLMPYSATNAASTLFIGRSPNTALTSIPMSSLTGTTLADQNAIATVDPSLSQPVAIANNAAVQNQVEMFGASIHGPGSGQFLAGNSSMQLNPAQPVLLPIATVNPQGVWNYNYIIMSEVTGISDPGGAPGAFVGRQKLTENSSPIPHDRVFVNYSYFNNVPLQRGGVNVNRVTPGFEKTFFNGNMSVEVRAPFATTLDSDVIAGGLSDTTNAQMGNVTLYFKALLLDAGYEAISAGLGMTLPTADDVTVRTAGGTSLLEIENKSIHLLPFIAGLYLPTERVFLQGIAQADLDSKGNPVRFSDFVNGVPNGNLLVAGRPNDANYVFFDVSLGYWLYQAPSGGVCCGNQCSGSGQAWIRGVAPIVELHYNGTLTRADSVRANRGASTVLIGNPARDNLDFWNVVLGLAVECRHNANLTVGYATPVSNRQDRQFDNELRVMFNWFFGGPERVHTCNSGRL